MPKRFYKFKLLLDENMPPRQRFPRLNSRFDVKHIRDDLNQAGLKDPPVYELAKTLNRLIMTFNGNDFKEMVVQSTKTGVDVLPALKDGASTAVFPSPIEGSGSTWV